MTIAHDFSSYAEWVKKVDAIIEKYRPAFIPEKAPEYTSSPWPVIRYYITFYRTLDELLSDVPYGGVSIWYPRMDSNKDARNHTSFGSGFSELIATQGMEYNGIYTQWEIGHKWVENKLEPTNYAFVLTFSCNYPFSNGLVKQLFNGGVNTVLGKECSGYNGIAKGKRGTKYLLWSRGAGMINPK